MGPIPFLTRLAVRRPRKGRLTLLRPSKLKSPAQAGLFLTFRPGWALASFAKTKLLSFN